MKLYTNIRCFLCAKSRLSGPGPGLGPSSPGSRACIRYRSSTSAVSVEQQQSSTPESEAFRDAKPFSDIPGPAGLPVLGTLLQYTRGPFSVADFHKALLSRYRQYGPIFKENIAGETVVHLLHPDYIKVVYLNEGKTPHIPPLVATTQMYRKYRGLSPGLGNTNGEQWYRLRSAVQQMMMRPKAVTMYLPGVNEVADDLIAYIDQHKDTASHQVADFTNLINLWQLESSGMTCFETRFGCFEAGPASHQQKMLDSSADIFRLSLKLKFSMPLYKYMSTPTWRQLLRAEDYFFGNGQKLVDETVGRIQTLVDEGRLEEGQFGFMTYLLSKPELTYKDLSIIALSLFGDGLSTTVPTLIGQLYCIASNPEKQEKLHAEIQSVIPEGAAITPHMINKLTYLKACVKEGFRFFPIGTEVSRIPQKDLVIGGYQIPAGTHIELNNNLLLRLSEYFDDAESYRPERWLRGEMERTIHPYLLIPFGHGPRMCAGRRFAEQEMYVVISKLVQKYELRWPHAHPMEQRYNLLLKPNTPADLEFIPRNL